MDGDVSLSLVRRQLRRQARYPVCTEDGSGLTGVPEGLWNHLICDGGIVINDK